MNKKYLTIPANRQEPGEEYDAPVIEKVEVRVEQGVQLSPLPEEPGGGGGGYIW